MDLTVQGTGRFEQAGSYARARRVGDHVYVSGTTAVEPSGRLHTPGDTYHQTLFALRRIETVLHRVHANLADVVAVRAYLSGDASTEDFVRAHGEIFAEILPACTAIRVSLSSPGMMVEIEVEAIAQHETTDPAASDHSRE